MGLKSPPSPAGRAVESGSAGLITRVQEIVRLKAEGATTTQLQQHFGADAAEYAAAKKTAAPRGP